MFQLLLLQKKTHLKVLHNSKHALPKDHRRYCLFFQQAM